MIKEICDYTVEAKPSEFHVDFKVSGDNNGEIEPMFEGYVRWDGCSNWNIPDGYYQIHFCSKKQAENLGKLLGALYEWAAELMPTHDDILND